MDLSYQINLFEPDTHLSSIRFVIIDTETTGFKKKDQFWEIAWISYQNNEVILSQCGETRVRPENILKIPDEHKRIKYLLDQNLHETRNRLPDGILKLSDDLKNGLPVVHNKTFDIPKLNEKFRQLNLPEIQMDDVFDPVDLSVALYGKKNDFGNGLTELCKRFGLSINEKRHSAYYDCKLTVRVMIRLLDELSKRGISKTIQGLWQATYGK